MIARKKSIVIVGNGMATCRLLDELVARNAQERYDITVVGDEPGGAYNRVMLSKVLEGAEPDAVVTKPPAWYDEHRIRLVSPCVAERIDTVERRVVLRGAEPLRYEIAILATGSQPVVPAIDGMHDEHGEPKPGLFVYRTMDDCLRMRDYARPGDNAVVLGGGLLGLEAAKVLSDRGLHVTVVHLAHGLMNTQLDFVGGEMLRRQIERCGIFVRVGRTIESVLGSERVEGVVLNDGERLSADVVVVACGIRPRIDVARKSQIPVNKGILVNDTLATQVPGVYAIGECTEHAGVTYGLVAPAWEQATVLAGVLTGAQSQGRYRGSKLYARLKVAGVEVASFGALEPSLETDRTIQVVEERDFAYRKLVLRGRQLVGAMFVGNVSNAASLVQTFDRGDPLPEDPLEVLCNIVGAGSGGGGDRTICNCFKVTESAIVACVKDGADSVEAVTEQTKAGSGCGSCKTEVARLVQLNAKPKLAATG
ncbi:FAD-dependent oxidoreductase [Sorangium sp. So ce726]|uniref:FAD-dependent oxidoreductase n=1 Tax=Sorangium sp. So ce726 TaxID=3133319 RepID=UPI003F622BBC